MKVGRPKAFCPANIAGIKVIKPCQQPLAGLEGDSQTEFHQALTPRILRIKALDELKQMRRVEFDDAIQLASLADGTGRAAALLIAGRIGVLNDLPVHGFQSANILSQVNSRLSELGIHLLSEVPGINISVLTKKLEENRLPPWLKLEEKERPTLRADEIVQLQNLQATPTDSQVTDIITRFVVGRLAGPRAYQAMTPQELINNTLQEFKGTDFVQTRDSLYALGGIYGSKQDPAPGVSGPDPHFYTKMMMDTGFFIGQAASLLFGQALFSQEGLEFVTNLEIINQALKKQEGSGSRTSSQIAVCSSYVTDFFAALVLGTVREDSNKVIILLQKISEHAPSLTKLIGTAVTPVAFIAKVITQLAAIEVFQREAPITHP